jgi:glycosyltransferase involved in cell wall biosynthesis
VSGRAASAPTVSVVIPVKDDAGPLERCLEALWEQTDRPDEIVVVDNGSTGLTRTVAGWWNTVYVYEARPGIAAAAAAGYDAATGDIIARVDADSVPPPDWVHGVRTRLEDRTIDAVTGPGSFASLPELLRRIADVTYMQAYFSLFGRLVGRTPLFGSNFAMRRTAWLDARGRTHRGDRRVHDDLDLSFGLPAGSTVVLDRSLSLEISARPFADPAAFARRVWRGAYTVGVNRRALALPWRR